MFAGKAIRCDCGHEVRAHDESGLVKAIQAHAWEAHGIEFSLELALDVARHATSEREALAGERNGTIGKEQ